MAEKTPRSHLYVPGDRPARFDTAKASGADALILDLEDGVLPEDKLAALDAVVDWLGAQPSGGPQLWVRVNRAATGELERLARCLTLTGLCLPKVESAEEVEAAHLLAPHLRLAPIVESARGLSQLAHIAATPALAWLHLGELDLAADLGVTVRTGCELSPYRAMVVLASRVAGLPAPPGPVSTELNAMDAFAASTRALTDHGFRGRACIHPRQVAVVHEMHAPTAVETAWARDLLDAATRRGAVFRDSHGQMVDEAVLRQARRIVSDSDR